MDYLNNHVWCTSSIWSGDYYYCRHLVTLDSYSKTNDDWTNIIDNKSESIPDQDMIKFLIKLEGYNDISELLVDNTHPVKYIPNLKPNILQWLHDNIKDRKDDECHKGWAVGSTDYRALNPYQFNIFFHRKKDAMAFIKKFSTYKKPTHITNYFADERFKLNIETMKYDLI